jgi:hypothetical protein
MGKYFASYLMAAMFGTACVTVPLDTEPGSGGLTGGSGAGGDTAASTTALDPAQTHFVSGTGGTVGATTSGAGGAQEALGSGGFATVVAPSDCAAGPVSFKTATVSLQALQFWIVADGKCYTSAPAKVQVHSDPGGGTYTTLELTWNENNREMRYFIYFTADRAGWWSAEMRTYNGQQPYSDWLYYYGTFFKATIGQPFVGDIDLVNDPQDKIRGELHLHGLTLSTTLTGMP